MAVCAPVITRVDGIDKDRPSILEIGDHGHAHHSKNKLYPGIGTKARRGYGATRFAIGAWNSQALRLRFQTWIHLRPADYHPSIASWRRGELSKGTENWMARDHDIVAIKCRSQRILYCPGIPFRQSDAALRSRRVARSAFRWAFTNL